MKVITIRLAAPLQSYGNVATFNHRTTSLHPTKSAIIGIIAAALGYRREDNNILKLNQLKFAVRVDQPGTVMEDFQTVEWNKSKGSKLTYREYIQDAVFLVAFGSDDDELMDNIFNALRRPKFALFLGRRSNPPAGVLEIEMFDSYSPLAILKNKCWTASDWYKRKNKGKREINVEIFYDSSLSNGGFAVPVKDEVISFDNRDRKHKARMEKSEYISLDNPLYEDAGTRVHDAMSIFN
ncbi:type I-E CRISPR-associated protein Cas5/CasD [Ligilactobacillus ruminis]|uniref:type I-E CRISPR-associated protein Cas5/CasD n=1 Tax=Ligilactobacillus ruminis TaxID=1623 RepID=UPI003CFC3CB6